MSLKFLCLNMSSRKSFCFFVRNFNINLVATGTLDMEGNIQYLFMPVCGESFRRFESFSADIESRETLNVE